MVLYHKSLKDFDIIMKMNAVIFMEEARCIRHYRLERRKAFLFSVRGQFTVLLQLKSHWKMCYGRNRIKVSDEKLYVSAIFRSKTTSWLGFC